LFIMTCHNQKSCIFNILPFSVPMTKCALSRIYIKCLPKYCRVVWVTATVPTYIMFINVLICSLRVLGLSIAFLLCLVLCLLLGFLQRCWLRRRAGLLCSEEASGRRRARMCCLDTRLRLVGGPR